jgi:hypothetical protein
MRTTLASGAFVLIGAGAMAVGAQLPNLRGTDSMEDVTRYMLNPQVSPFCAGATGLQYVGGCSSGGELAMTGTGPAPLNIPLQSLGPMTRTIGSSICNTKQGNPGTAANQFVCLDGSAVMAGVAGVSAASCDLSYTPGHLTDWRNVLRMIYAGAGPGDSTVPRDCARPERVALVNNWGSLWNGTCSGTAGCTQLRHAFRRADVSGTIDTFLSLLSLPALANNPFCNGVGLPTFLDGINSTSDFADNDPIRRKCAFGAAQGNEEVCNRAGLPSSDPNSNTLGVVLPVHPRTCPRRRRTRFRPAPSAGSRWSATQQVSSAPTLRWAPIRRSPASSPTKSCPAAVATSPARTHVRTAGSIWRPRWVTAGPTTWCSAEPTAPSCVTQ